MNHLDARTKGQREKMTNVLYRHTYNYVLLHDFEGNMGEYSVSDRPYQPDHISLISGRDDTEVENGIFPPIARPEELQ